MRLVIFLVLFCFSGLAISQQEVFSSDLQTDKKPWTNLNFANDPMDFQFAIVSDRTGGPRPGIFEDAIKKINWLMPEFVISVGDLIKGAKGKDAATLDQQWKGHFERIAPLKMPFFHLAGNHDIKANNAFQVDYWNRLFGAPYYSFVYKDVLFLNLFSNQGSQVIYEDQRAYVKEILEANKEVRWTMVFMHHPLWRYPHDSGFDEIEKMLANRKFTVFAGHQHHYHHSVHQDANYYVLATTGGGSPLLGNSFGSFDHLTWVTMTDDGPVLANLRLDGILPHDVANEETQELTRHLLRSIQVEKHVFVDSPDLFSKGKAFLQYNNSSNHSLFAKGEFYHNHHVLANPARFEIEIPAQSSKMVEIDLVAIEAFKLDQRVQLEFTGSLGYRHDDYPDLKVSGNVDIPIKATAYDLLPTKELHFVDTHPLEMTCAIPDATIRYTLDGTEPTAESEVYTHPIDVEKSASIKACVFLDEEELIGKPVSMQTKEITPGPGMLIACYPYGLEAKMLGNMPDFSAFQPQKIIAKQILDPVKVAGREEQFALVYKGYLTLEESGMYTISATSDDGIKILINNEEVVSDMVKHKAREVKGQVELKKGKHPIEIQYFQWKRKYAMDIQLTTPGGEIFKLDSRVLSYDENTMPYVR